jgi:hypothetical protein
MPPREVAAGGGFDPHVPHLPVQWPPIKMRQAGPISKKIKKYAFYDI